MFASLCLMIAGAKLSVCADRLDVVIVMRASLKTSTENIGFKPDSLQPERRGWCAQVVPKKRESL